MLEYLQLQFRLIATKGLELPAFKGPTLRGAFGHALRKVTCPYPHRVAGDCALGSNCKFTQLFEPQGTLDAERFSKHDTRLPNPFVLIPPNDKSTQYSMGNELVVGFTLFGRAIGEVASVLMAFESLARFGLGRDKTSFKLSPVEYFQKNHWNRLERGAALPTCSGSLFESKIY